jgi:hypothetical protein
MTRISDLEKISKPPLTSVTVVSDGILTHKITLSDLRNTILPIASKTSIGSVQIGDGLRIDNAGVIAVENYSAYTLPMASPAVLGGIKIGNGLSIDGYGSVSVNRSVEVATRVDFGTVKIGNGIDVTNGVISVSPTISSSNFGADGVTVGVDNQLKLSVINDQIPTLSSLDVGLLDLSIKNTTNTIASIKFLSSELSYGRGGPQLPSLIPDSGSMSLGIISTPWESIYARTLYGNVTGIATKSNTLLYNSTYIGTSINSDINTIAVRDTSGNITANGFKGIADKSNLLKVDGNYFTSSPLPNPNTISSRDASGQLLATRFVGVSEKSDLLKIDTLYVQASTSPTPNTIAARNDFGNIAANEFNGIATTARYADLAEKYVSDDDYEFGTVVIFGGVNEITISTIMSDTRVAGVISEFPAHLMNSEEDGLPVALRGKVPVKVIGIVNKGDLLVSSAIPGHAMSIGKDRSHGIAVFAKSIVDKLNHDRGTVMAVIL